MKTSATLGVIVLPFLTTLIGYICTGIYFNIQNSWRFFFLFFSVFLVVIPAIFYWTKHFKLVFLENKANKVKRVYILCMERQKYSVATKIYHKYKDLLLEDTKTMSIMHTLVHLKN